MTPVTSAARGGAAPPARPGRRRGATAYRVMSEAAMATSVPVAMAKPRMPRDPHARGEVARHHVHDALDRDPGALRVLDHPDGGPREGRVQAPRFLWLTNPENLRRDERTPWRAAPSRLESFQKLAQMLRTHLDGVLGWTRLSVTNGALEGMSNKVKVNSHRPSASEPPGYGSRTSTTAVRVGRDRDTFEKRARKTGHGGTPCPVQLPSPAEARS